MDDERAPIREPLPWRAAAIGLLILFAASAGAGFLGARWRRDVDQPLAFNHAKHVVENEIDCSSCHLYYETETFSGLPAMDVCASCHSEALGKSKEEARLVKMIANGETLDWKPLFRQPSHVFYSHRRHVMSAKLGCEACHGAIAKTKSPPPRVKRLRMDDCIECHRQRGVAADCTTCHR